jgi:hypothetical protein
LLLVIAARDVELDVAGFEIRLRMIESPGGRDSRGSCSDLQLLHLDTLREIIRLRVNAVQRLVVENRFFESGVHATLRVVSGS